MRSVLSILVGLILGSAIQANACPRIANQLICPGDTVVSNDNIVGTVLGVNPYQGTVAFRSVVTGTVFTRNKQTLALGLGCLEMYCVGDRIVSNDNIVATILAVNPYQNTVAFRSVVTGTVFTRNLNTLALGLGCVRGICVDDKIISSDNIVGKVLAVNPFNGTIAFKSDITGTVFTRSSQTLASSEYCDTYGSYPRSHNRYPFVNDKMYIDKDLKFSLQRPQLL